MKRRNPLLIAFGTVITVLVFVLFIVQGWSYFKWNDGKPLSTLDPSGHYAKSILDLANPVFYIAAAVFFGVLGAVLYIGFRFRDREELETADEIPAQLHGKTWAEITWTVIPAVVLLVVGMLTVITLGDLNAAAAQDSVKVRVEGQQWWWSYKYDTNGNGTYGDEGDIITANELVVPVGTEVALQQTSNDVIHSHWIPALNGKKDAVPGMTTDWKLKADQPGVFMGQCTEFCGLSHANMRMLVRAVPADQWETWRDNQLKPAKEPAPGSVEAAGKDVFSNQLCSSCHLIRGVNDGKPQDPAKGVKSLVQSGAAPDLTHFATRGTFAGSIYNSRMPNPTDNDQPFGQTCQVRGVPGTASAGLGGGTVEVNTLPTCEDPNQRDAKDIPWATRPGNPDNPPNRTALAAWLRNPPEMKPMAAGTDVNTDEGDKYRGMPNLQLSEDQIDQLVAYLNSLS